MKKAILYLIVAALAPVVMPANATNSSPHPSVVENNPTAMRSPGIRSMFRQHHHRRRIDQFDFGYGGGYPDSYDTPDLDAPGGVPYGPEAEDVHPPEDFSSSVPTRCVPENYTVPSERGDHGQVQVTVTRCNVPMQTGD